jgi:hypothetical protein
VKRLALGLSLGVAALFACGNDTDDASGPAGNAMTTIADAAAPDAPNAADPCADAGSPPPSLECTGLYSNFADKTLSPSALAYTPAVPLWSDGAAKERWIELPAGTQIDISDPNNWVFPIGTKLFKQFTYGGRRVETRLFQKQTSTYWIHATYAWNADETAAAISYGDTVSTDSDGGTWIVPASTDCDSCHRGRPDHILGFEAVSLGSQGASGLTLNELAERGLLTPTPSVTNLRIGDDGSGLAAPALGWLHVNCGVTCHNTNENAVGYGAKMDLRLDATRLDGSPPNAATWGPLATTLNVLGVSGNLAGSPRIVPGDPSGSGLVGLISERGDEQMPPIATRVVDHANVAIVTAWIRSLQTDGICDAGISDAGIADAGGDADAGSDDAGADAGDDAAIDSGGDAASDADAGP